MAKVSDLSHNYDLTEIFLIISKFQLQLSDSS